MRNSVLFGAILLLSIIFVSGFSLADTSMEVTLVTDQNVTYQQAIIADGDVVSQHDIMAGGDSVVIINGVEWTQYDPGYIAKSESKWGDNGLEEWELKELMEKLEAYRNGESVEITDDEYDILTSLLALSDAEIIDFYNSQISPILNSHSNQITSSMYEIEAAYITFEKLYPDIYCESRQEVMKKYGLKSVKCGLHSKQCYNAKFYPHEGGLDYCIYTDERPEGGMDIRLEKIRIYDSEENSLTAFEVVLYNQGEEAFSPVLKVDVKKWENTLGHIEQELEELGPGETRTYFVAWDNTGMEPGEYNAKATVYLGKKEILMESAFTILPEGSLVRDGEIVSIGLGNEPLTYQDTVIETAIKNQGEIPAAFQVTGEVYKDGELIETLQSPKILIKSGETEKLPMVFRVPDIGEYEVLVKSNDNMEDMFVFEAVPSTITGRFMASPGEGVIGFIFALAVALYGTRYLNQRRHKSEKYVVTIPGNLKQMIIHSGGKKSKGTIEFIKPLSLKKAGGIKSKKTARQAMKKSHGKKSRKK